MSAQIVTNNTRQALWLADVETTFDGDVMASTKADTRGQLWERVAEASDD